MTDALRYVPSLAGVTLRKDWMNALCLTTMNASINTQPEAQTTIPTVA